MVKIVVSKEVDRLVDVEKTYSFDSVVTLAELFGIGTKKRIFRHDFPSKRVDYLGTYVKKCFENYLEGILSFNDSFLYVRRELLTWDNSAVTRNIFKHLVAVHKLDSFKYDFRNKDGYLRRDLDHLIEEELVLKVSTFYKYFVKGLSKEYSLWQTKKFVRNLQRENLVNNPVGTLGSYIYWKEVFKIIDLIEKER